jgi:hypothetical protein
MIAICELLGIVTRASVNDEEVLGRSSGIAVI